MIPQLLHQHHRNKQAVLNLTYASCEPIFMLFNIVLFLS